MNSKIENSLFSFLLPWLVFILIPGELILKNWRENPVTLLLPILFVAFFLVFWTTSYRVIISRKKGATAVKILSFFSILIFLNLGIEGVKQEHLLAVDLVIVLITSLMVWKREKLMLKRCLAFASVFFLFTGSLKLFDNFQKNLNKPPEKNENLKKTTASIKHSPQKRLASGNIYHIWLDAFQGDALDFFEKKRPDLIPKDFFRFSSFYTEYNRTHLTMANVFQGQSYDNSRKLDEWLTSFWEGSLFKILFENDWNINLYPNYTYNNSSFSKQTKPAANIISREENLAEIPGWKPPGQFDKITLLLDLWIRQFIPKSLLWHLENNWFGERFKINVREGKTGFSFLSLFGLRKVTQISEAPVFSYLNFKRLLLDEYKRASNGNYVFYHGIIPHGPYILDSEGGFRSHADSTLRSYLNMAELSLKMVQELVILLKKLNRFKNSTIIVHSDHGYYFPSKSFSFFEKSGNPKMASISQDPNSWKHEEVETMARGILMIKFANHENGKLVGIPVQSDRLLPTILNQAAVLNQYKENLSMPLITSKFSGNTSLNHFVGDSSKPESDARPPVLYHYRKLNGQWKNIGFIESTF